MYYFFYYWSIWWIRKRRDRFYHNAFLNLYNRMNLIRVNATKSAVILIYTAGAFLTFLINDLVNFGYGLSLGFGTLWRMVGKSLQCKKGEDIVRIFLVISAILFSFKLWVF